MRIRRLESRDFRRYRDLDIDLAPGLTVIRGPNEAGKSTIQRAHRARPHPPGDEHRPATSRRSGRGSAAEDARPVITIEFEQDDEDGQKVGHAREDLRRVARARSASTSTASRSPTRPSPTRSWPS